MPGDDAAIPDLRGAGDTLKTVPELPRRESGSQITGACTPPKPPSSMGFEDNTGL